MVNSFFIDKLFFFYEIISDHKYLSNDFLILFFVFIQQWDEIYNKKTYFRDSILIKYKP